MALILNERDADYSVPGINSTANVTGLDVIGNKTDNWLGNSLYARVDELYDQFQVERNCYPTLASPISVVSNSAPWAYGAYTEIIPASTITNNFHLLSIVVEACDEADTVAQLALYSGSADDLVTTVRFGVVGGFFGNCYYPTGSEEIDDNGQVRARVATSTSTTTLGISLTYLEHV